jgi:hypothetical protein
MAKWRPDGGAKGTLAPMRDEPVGRPTENRVPKTAATEKSSGKRCDVAKY